MSKVAIVLTGCSYGKRNDNRVLKTDWNQSKASIKNNVIDCFLNQGHEVNVYLTTYVSDQTQHILDFYNPKKTLFLQFSGSQQRSTYIQSMSQLFSEEVDLIISTRFDIAFHNPLTNFNIDYNKFNFFARLSKLRYWEDHRYIDDNLFIFPKKYLTPMIESLAEISQIFHSDAALHPLYNPISSKIGESNVNFMVNNLTNATSGEYYNLMRVCDCSKMKDACDCWTEAFKWQG